MNSKIRTLIHVAVGLATVVYLGIQDSVLLPQSSFVWVTGFIGVLIAYSALVIGLPAYLSYRKRQANLFVKGERGSYLYGVVKTVALFSLVATVVQLALALASVNPIQLIIYALTVFFTIVMMQLKFLFILVAAQFITHFVIGWIPNRGSK